MPSSPVQAGLFAFAVVLHLTLVGWMLVRGEIGGDLEVYQAAFRTFAEGASPYAPREGPPYIYAPAFLWLSGPILQLAEPTLARAWLLLGEISFFVSCWLLRSSFAVPGWAAFTVLALLPATYEDLAWGQVDLMMLAVLLGAHHLECRDRSAVAGALLVAGSMAKPMPLLLVLLWLVQGRWRAVAWTVGLLVLAALGLGIKLPGLTRQFAGVLLGIPAGAYGLWLPATGFGNHSAPNAIGVLAAVIGVELPRALAIGTPVVLLLGVVFSRARHLRTDPRAGLATVGVLAILLPPFAWEAYLVFAVPGVIYVLTRPAAGRTWSLVRGASLLLYVPYVLWGGAVRACTTVHPDVAHGLDELRFLCALTVFMGSSGVIASGDARVATPPRGAPARSAHRRPVPPD